MAKSVHLTDSNHNKLKILASIIGKSIAELVNEGAESLIEQRFKELDENTKTKFKKKMTAIEALNAE